MTESLKWDVLAIDRASKTFDKIGSSAQTMGGKVGKVGKGVAIAFGGAAVGAVVGLGAAFKDAFISATDLQKITAQTSGVIKSTGGAAKVSAGHVRDLANQINNYSTTDDDVIQQGENMLLTFTNIRNGVGKSNQVFDQATKTLVDMSTAMGSDPKTAAIQLGKALNDPVKGVGALSKVGVTFDAQQKKSIASMVKSGNTMGAQKVILKELGKEFGGSAKAAGDTFAGSMFHLKDGLADTLRDGITPLLPSIQKLANWLAVKLPAGVQALVGWVSGLKGQFSATSGEGSKIAGVFKAIAGWVMGQLVPALTHLGQQVLPTAKKAIGDIFQALKNAAPEFKILGTVLTAIVLPVVGQLAKILVGVLGPALKLVGTIIGTIVAPALKLIITIFLDVVGVLITGAAKAFGWIPGIGGKLKKAAKDFQTFKNNVNDQLNGIKKSVTIDFHSQMDAGILAALKAGGQKGAKAAQGVHGRTAFASGTPSAPAGWAVVGERGRELVRLSGRERIYTAGQTAGMMGRGGGGGADFTATAPLVLKLEGRDVVQAVLTFKRRSGVTSLGLA